MAQVQRKPTLPLLIFLGILFPCFCTLLLFLWCQLILILPCRERCYWFALTLLLCDRRLGEDSDSDFRDSSSDGSSDCERERGLKYSREQWSHHCIETEIRMDPLSLRDQHNVQEDLSSDEGEATNSQGRLIFEYFERDAPYSREPLANKASVFFFLVCSICSKRNRKYPLCRGLCSPNF